jgi:large subunit ribosomal protein L10e
MAKLRKFCAYRRLERPYTRKSKYRSKSFVRASPHSKIVRYNMGDPKKDFPVSLKLVSKSDLNIRHNALESARLVTNKILEKQVGKSNYYFTMRVYPHHILRENPLASGAGADRMSTGMKKSFGKSIGRAARIKKGQTIFQLDVSKEGLKTARKALKLAYTKLPCSCTVLEE